MSDKQDKRLLIIFESEGGNVNDWEWFDGSLGDAIKHVTTDHRWCNYGRNGAWIVEANPCWHIGFEKVERRYIAEHTYLYD
jgi:hypothetical protein